MTDEEMKNAIQHLTTKSGKIRVLAKLGATRAQIAKFLDIRYQHVRNVLVQPEPQLPDVMPTPSLDGLEATHLLGGNSLTIEQAKLGLSAHFGVEPGAIEITIRG